MRLVNGPGRLAKGAALAVVAAAAAVVVAGCGSGSDDGNGSPEIGGRSSNAREVDLGGSKNIVSMNPGHSTANVEVTQTGSSFTIYVEAQSGTVLLNQPMLQASPLITVDDALGGDEGSRLLKGSFDNANGDLPQGVMRVVVTVGDDVAQVPVCKTNNGEFMFSQPGKGDLPSGWTATVVRKQSLQHCARSSNPSFGH